MSDEVPKGQSGYVCDDAEMIANMITKYWAIPEVILKKPIVFFNMDVDPDTFNFSTGETQLVVYADDEVEEARGIGYDGVAPTRIINIHIYNRSREKVIKTTDEVKRILYEHAVRPGNNWHLIYNWQSTPIRQGRKMCKRKVTVTLKSYWRPRLNPMGL